jgi:hypothetical protein
MQVAATRGERRRAVDVPAPSRALKRPPGIRKPLRAKNIEPPLAALGRLMTRGRIAPSPDAGSRTSRARPAWDPRHPRTTRPAGPSAATGGRSDFDGEPATRASARGEERGVGERDGLDDRQAELAPRALLPPLGGEALQGLAGPVTRFARDHANRAVRHRYGRVAIRRSCREIDAASAGAVAERLVVPRPLEGIGHLPCGTPRRPLGRRRAEIRAMRSSSHRTRSFVIASASAPRRTSLARLARR